MTDKPSPPIELEGKPKIYRFADEIFRHVILLYKKTTSLLGLSGPTSFFFWWGGGLGVGHQDMPFHQVFESWFGDFLRILPGDSSRLNHHLSETMFGTFSKHPTSKSKEWFSIPLLSLDGDTTERIVCGIRHNAARNTCIQTVYG